MAEDFGFLRGIPLFAGLADEDIRLIETNCRELCYAAREVIFREGDEGRDLFIIADGSVEIWKDYLDADADLLSVYNAGDLFGEMALIDDAPRSATVVARQPCRLLAISRPKFESITKASPISRLIMRSLTAMIRRRTETFMQGMEIRNRKLQIAYDRLRKSESRHRMMLREREAAHRTFQRQVQESIGVLGRLTAFGNRDSTAADHRERLATLSLFYESAPADGYFHTESAAAYLKRVAVCSHRPPPSVSLSMEPRHSYLSVHEAMIVGLALTEVIGGVRYPRRIILRLHQDEADAIEIELEIVSESVADGQIIPGDRLARAEHLVVNELNGRFDQVGQESGRCMIRIPRGRP